MARRARVDAELVRRGLARSRQQAAELIGAGKVRIDGLPAVKPATAVSDTTALTVVTDSERAWVSRGAHKLVGALEAFAIAVAGTGAGLAQRRRQGQPAAGPIGQCRVLPVVAHADRPGIVGQGIGGCGAPCD